MKKRIITISLITLLLLLLPSAQLHAQGGSLYNPGSGQQAICRGTRDWATFLSALISYDDFAEYWKDFSRYETNICQYMDIDNLLNRITKVRQQLRNAFYVCGDTSKLKDTYYRLEAELYFLRKYIDTENGNFIVTSDQQMMNDLQSYFIIQDYFTPDQIPQLFSDLKSKYQPRLDTYKNCQDPTWQNLVNKWNEFHDNVLILFSEPGKAPAIQAASASISKRWERMANTPMKGGQSFFGGYLDWKINGLPGKEGLDLIGQELKKNWPNGYTFNQLQAAQTVADNTYNEQTTFAGYAASYQAQYGETSGQYVTQILYRLDVLDKIIRQTFPFENQTYQCVRRIINKQC